MTKQKRGFDSGNMHVEEIAGQRDREGREPRTEETERETEFRTLPKHSDRNNARRRAEIWSRPPDPLGERRELC